MGTWRLHFRLAEMSQLHEGPFSFLVAPLELIVAGDMLNRVASEMRCAPVELGHWLIDMCEAQRSSDMVSCRQEAGPFVLSTNLRLQKTADHP